MNTDSWKKFLIVFGMSLSLCATVLFLFILIMDPYNTLPFSPNWKRVPVCSNQRFSYPTLTKREEFDSAIFGTSTTRLLEPSVLNTKFKARFVNLSMDSATHYEQKKIFELFLKHHPNPKYIIIGIDKNWCNAKLNPEQLTERPFPAWMYDKNPWLHPFYMFDKNTLLQAYRQLCYLNNKLKPRFGLDGYANFLPDEAKYDLKRAQAKIYTSEKLMEENIPADYESKMIIKPLKELQAMIGQLPSSTQIFLVIVPYHHHIQASPKTREGVCFKKCKSQLIEMMEGNPNMHIFDFMIPSDITLKDENYWDPLHYNLKMAELLMNSLEEGIKTSSSKPNLYYYYSKN